MTIYSQVASNKRKTILVMIVFIFFISTVAYLIGKWLGYGLGFAGIWLIISGIMSFGSYFYSDKLVLAQTGAKLATKEDYPNLNHIVENMSIASGLPMPKVYVVNDQAPNAFATGRDPKHAVVCATSGLLSKLTDTELEGVIAHEMSHVKNYDTRLMGVVAILVGTIALLTNFFWRSMWFRGSDRDREGGNAAIGIIAIVAAILAPIIAALLQFAISRRREYLADADGALLTRYPDGLADALQKIADDQHQLHNANVSTAHLFIENPFKSGSKSNAWFVNLFSTHPPIQERIKILREM